MADHAHSERTGGSNAVMAFIVGGLVVAVAVIAWLMFGGDPAGPAGDGGTSITIESTTGGGSEAAPGGSEAPGSETGASDIGGATEGEIGGVETEPAGN